MAKDDAKKKPDAKTKSPPGSPRNDSKGNSPPGSPKKKKGKKGKSNRNKKMTLLFFVNGRADTQPFRESKVKINALNEIMQTNLHGEWEYRNHFICNLDGSLLKDPHTSIKRSMAFVMVPRSENFKPGYYQRMFVKYMQEWIESKKQTSW